MPGPYVAAAAICEKVLRERDGVLTLVRIIDRIEVQVSGPGAPPELPEGQLQLTLVIMLKADDALGRHPLVISPQTPAGVRLTDQTIDVVFEGQDRGVNVVANLRVSAEEGLFWFDIFFDDNRRLLTRIPLRVIYQRVPGPR